MSCLPFPATTPQVLAEGVVLLPGRVAARDDILSSVTEVLRQAPPRHYATPWGKPMSVGITNCGSVGWLSDSDGYRYVPAEPEFGRPWPAMPTVLRDIAVEAAGEAGFCAFAPDACLVNVYDTQSKMGLHQDRDEPDLSQPIVSVSLGRAARFRFGGARRAGPTRSLVLCHGDIVVFGGSARLMYHGIDGLVGEAHPVLGERRINLTFRHVGRLSA